MPADPYETLGVARSATADDITKAYRKLARQFHPDRNPGDKAAEARFKEIANAYEIVGDTEKRQQYDQFGSVGGPGGPAPGGFHFGGNPEDAERVFRQFFGGGSGAPDLGDLFNAGGQRRGGRRKPAPAREDSRADVTIDFLTAALGGPVALSVDGREVNVKVPAGIEDGKTLRLAGQADGADLLLKIHVAPHPYFRRDGADVIVEIPVSVAEAILGAAVDVPTLEGGTLSLKVRPGTSAGQKLRVRGQGIKGGDLYVQIKVVVPTAVDDESRKLIEEFARRNPQTPRSDVPW